MMNPWGAKLPSIKTPAVLLLAIAVAACGAGSDGGDSQDSGDTSQATMQSTAPQLAGNAGCDGSDLGFRLPEEFCATVFHTGGGRTRHIEVSGAGDVFVGVMRSRDSETQGVLALRDSDGDGVADEENWFGEVPGNEVLLHGGYLYFAPDDAVLRYPIENGSLAPSGDPEVVVSGLPADRNHAAKSIAIGPDGGLYVNIGEIGIITPPFGIGCFVVKDSLPDKGITLEDVFMGAFPFVLLMLAVLALLAAFPILSTALL